MKNQKINKYYFTRKRDQGFKFSYPPELPFHGVNEET